MLLPQTAHYRLVSSFFLTILIPISKPGRARSTVSVISTQNEDYYIGTSSLLHSGKIEVDYEH